MSDNNSHAGLIAGVSAALAAGAVYFYGPEGDRHRKKFRGWMLKTKGDVLERLEEAEKVSKEKYDEFVDAAVAEYAERKAETEAEVELLREELKSEWKTIKQQAQEKGEQLQKDAAEEVAKRAEQLSQNIAPEEN